MQQKPFPSLNYSKGGGDLNTSLPVKDTRQQRIQILIKIFTYEKYQFLLIRYYSYCLPGAQPSTGASTKFSCCSILLTILNSRVITLILNFKFIRLRMIFNKCLVGLAPLCSWLRPGHYGGIGMKKIYDSLLFSFLLLQIYHLFSTISNFDVLEPIIARLCACKARQRPLLNSFCLHNYTNHNLFIYYYKNKL